jgi:phage baseplate assembly protein W
MYDICHQFGADLMIGATGDLLAVNAPLLTQQRVLRRLLTNPGDYIWQPTYGAGLAQFVGQPVNAAHIRAVVRSQIFQEAAVAQNPQPVIDVQGNTDSSVYVYIRYADATSGETQVLSFSVGGPA